MPTTAPDPAFDSHAGRRAAETAMARVRRRMRADLVPLAAISLFLAAPAGEATDRLLLVILLASLAILLFVLRRGHDIDALAAADRWRAAAVEGRGVSLADWHAGAGRRKQGGGAGARPAAAQRPARRQGRA